MMQRILFPLALWLAAGSLPAAYAEELANTSAVVPAQLAELVKIDVLVGTGAEVVAKQPVLVHYTGWLYDESAPKHHGTKFDSSRPNNKPFQFTLGEGKVIDGWEQGILGMKLGGKRTLIIPPHLGYGEKGSGKTIPGNATLIFDVEALEPPPPLPVLTEILKTDTLIGRGVEAEAGMSVVVLTRGWVYDTTVADHRGAKFDDVRAIGSSLDFVVGANRVLKGIDQGVVGMKVGGKRVITVPPHLGFGGRKVGIMVPANSILIYELELVSARRAQ